MVLSILEDFFGILLLMWVIGIVFIVFAILNVMTTELALTNKRVIAKFGFIRRQTIEININRIESISVNQGFWGRIFNYGSIVVRGTGGSHAPIPYIARPMEFRQQFNDFIDNEIGGDSKNQIELKPPAVWGGWKRWFWFDIARLLYFRYAIPITVISAQVGLTRLEALKYRKLVMFAIAKL